MIELHPFKNEWQEVYRNVAVRLRALVPQDAALHHIGSTAIAGLRAKNIIDIQVSVRSLGDVDIASMETQGFRFHPGLNDHCPEGMSLDAPELEKRYFNLAKPAANIHVRERGRLNQRFALVSRDYLRANKGTAKAYEKVKCELADRFPEEKDFYYAIKDPLFDVIYFAAEHWALASNWFEPPSD
jgi:GrpB-like predicted nucleotidyltransferase (UPF0157 family)